jgi:hypothetical protein
MSRLLTITFTTPAFKTEAAYGSLKPTPTGRLRRTYLHLSCSMMLSHLLDTVTPSPSQIPYVNLSIHTARVTARRLPPSAEPSGSSRFDPVGPSSTAMTCPLRSTSITLASTLLQGSPPLSGASVLSASRFEPLVPFPWHRRPGSHVPHKSQIELRAAYMPDAAWAVSGHPPS